MKKYAVYSFLAVVAVLSVFMMAFSPSDKASADTANNYILVEIYEVPSYKDNGVHIHYGNNKRELIPFKPFTADNHDAPTTQSGVAPDHAPRAGHFFVQYQ